MAGENLIRLDNPNWRFDKIIRRVSIRERETETQIHEESLQKESFIKVKLKNKEHLANCPSEEFFAYFLEF